MSEKLSITEEMKVHEKWYKESKEINMDTLPEFLRALTEDYGHDYGTICHAIAAGSIATARAMDGGITGFQASAIMWQFIREWNYSNNKTGLKIVDYDNFLYPQYAERHGKTISSSTWAALQKEARLNIEKAKIKYKEYLESLVEYDTDIEIFVKKYPDYYDRKDHYDPIGIGTGSQWGAEKKKKDSGFEFAPQSPYEPIGDSSRVYKHWQSIVDGVVPFGYSATKE